jgi:hypothetical protein
VGEQGVEQLLIADRDPDNFLQRISLVRYVMVEGPGGEARRAVFKNELTDFDYEPIYFALLRKLSWKRCSRRLGIQYTVRQIRT